MYQGAAAHWRCARHRQVLGPIRKEGLVPPPESRVICVDNSDATKLREALGRSRLCLNCTGPYRFLGEAIVSACIDAG